jgi:hypothetical protein
MLEFRCPNCSQWLVVREDRAGRMSRCPRCKAEIAIPQASAPEPVVETAGDELTLITPAKPLDKAMLDLPDEQELRDRIAEHRHEEERLLTSLGIQRKPPHTGQRRFAWPIDILLYPTSASGLIVMAVLIGAPLALALIQSFLPMVGRIGFVFFLASVILGLYAAWYLAECVYDSALGGTRAPEFVGVGLGDMWSRVVYLLAVYFLYLLPTILCAMLAQRADAIFWGLAAYSLVFFPIGLLAMVVNDSISALNPVFLVVSIFRAFFPYVGLLLVLVILGALYWFASQIGLDDGSRPFWLEAVGLVASMYGTFVLAHVLGRFYWRNADRLDWGL